MTMQTSHSVTHATFVIERSYPAACARVFAAFADPKIKARWFGNDELAASQHELDFRVGGREINRGGPPDGPTFTYEARYEDILTDERIVTSYVMYMGDTRISVSVATVELRPESGGTRLVYTEQGAYLDGYDNPMQREEGCRELLESLGTELSRSAES
jgi:uncharacterized protein YndB with AHSA1/START domain